MAKILQPIKFNALQAFMQTRVEKKKNDVSVTTPIAYPTGFLPMDYANGQRINVFDDDDNIIESYDSIGLVGGTMTTIVSDPGLGKTTLMQQIAVQIASQYENSFIIHEDIEDSSHINRVYNITGKSPKWLKNHYTIQQGGHTEDIWDRILDHAKMKINNRKYFEYDTGLKDLYGSPIKTLVPTFVLIDSLAVMRSEELDIGEDGKNKDAIEAAAGNMSGARTAKLNAEFFKQIMSWAKKANIMIFIINQISRKISSGYGSPARDLVGMGENESLSGSRAALYLANNVIRLKNKGQLKPDEKYGINGNLIGMTFYKSRTNATNVDVTLVFDKYRGFSKCLTLLQFALDNNIVKKKGNKYVIPGYEEDQFSLKTFMDTVVDKPKLLEKLYDLCLPKLQEYLVPTDMIGNEKSSKDSDEYENTEELFDLLNELYA